MLLGNNEEEKKRKKQKGRVEKKNQQYPAESFADSICRCIGTAILYHNITKDDKRDSITWFVLPLWKCLSLEFFRCSGR